MATLTDADLHGLVDGHLEAGRRAEVLRQAAASPRDRALVEAWQDQTDLIRATFAGIEREPVPPALDLRTRPSLHAVTDAPRPSTPRTAPRATSWRRATMTVATLAAMGVGLAGSWYVARLPVQPDRTVPSRAALDDERLIADRTIAALAFADADAATSRMDNAAPPVVASIPDLSKAGFTLVDAEARGATRRSLVFRYRNRAGERVAVGVQRSEGDDAGLLQRDAGYTWRNAHIVYAVFGTVPADRLLAVASALRGDAGD